MFTADKIELIECLVCDSDEALTTRRVRGKKTSHVSKT